jgi:hypothetical protein
MKILETKRMHNLRDECPEVFLPADIDFTLEDAIDEKTDMDNAHDNSNDSGKNNTSSEDHVISLESSYRLRKMGSGKNKKNLNDEYYNLES